MLGEKIRFQIIVSIFFHFLMHKKIIGNLKNENPKIKNKPLLFLIY